MSVRFILAPTVELAQNYTRENNVAITVEAEYGAHVIEGSLYTAAHHQPAGSPYAGRHLVSGGRASPCNDESIPLITSGDVLLSHVDLDTFGGCLRALGDLSESGYLSGSFADLFEAQFESFWDLAERIDTRGPHKLAQIDPDVIDSARLFAFWAWSESNRAPRERDRVHDVTELVLHAGVALRAILAGDNALLEAGRAFRDRGESRNRDSFRRHLGGVIVREAAAFVNDLYTDPHGDPAACVVAFNTTTKAIMISLADPLPGVSARVIVQNLWGAEAGGHDGIAGSPRGREMTEQDLEAAVMAADTAVHEGLGRVLRDLLVARSVASPVAVALAGRGPVVPCPDCRFDGTYGAGGCVTCMGTGFIGVPR